MTAEHAKRIPSLDEAWVLQMYDIMREGQSVSPRGKITKELPQKTLVFDMKYPVITIPERKMGYRFMAAEAWWILSGRNDVASIAKYSKAISQFSDDGETFFGSYGPPIVEQLDYVVRALANDPHTRQAVMTTWRQNPPPTKDVPCTIAFSFMIRNGKLNTHVFMRSSDNWLGIPYDAFNFTMITCQVLREMNARLRESDMPLVELGAMHLTAASSHIYEINFDAVRGIVQESLVGLKLSKVEPVPPHLYGIFPVGKPDDYMGLVEFLSYLKDIKDADEKRYRWWQR